MTVTYLVYRLEDWGVLLSGWKVRDACLTHPSMSVMYHCATSRRTWHYWQAVQHSINLSIRPTHLL